MRAGQVVRIRRHAAAYHFGVNFGPTGLGVFVFLQNQATGSLAHHEAVAGSVERPRGGGGVFVVRREGLAGVEATHARLADRGFGATADNNVGFAQTDVVERVNQRRVGTGAGRDGGEIRPPEAVLDGNHARSDVSDGLGDEKRIETRRAVAFGELGHLLLEGEKTAVARTPDHAHAVFVHFLQVEARVFQGFVGGNHGVLRIRVHLPHLRLLEVLQRVVAFDFASEFGFEKRGVEAGDGGRAAGSGNEAFPKFLRGVANGGQGSQPRDDYSFQLDRFQWLNGWKVTSRKVKGSKL